MTTEQELRKAIRASNLPPSDRAVFLARLDAANFGTALLPERFTGKQVKVARETGYSRRQTQYAEAHLALHGWLATSKAPADGRRRVYRLMVGKQCDCTGRRQVPGKQEIGATVIEIGATVAPKSAQPIGATAQVRGRFQLGGTKGGEVEGEPARPQCIGGCGKPARRACSTCWDCRALEPDWLMPGYASGGPA